ncbi:GIY-YIG nuclease family protein [Candidatus Babeliales bacterium]|nr:GIY-YIG nuclease family protein [Candidatus Babeliales bacterium]
MPSFYIYILKCNDDSYYTGHTDNIEKRITEHKLGLCDCYTKKRLPVFLRNLVSFGR